MTCKDCINYKLCQEVNSLPCRDEFAWYRYESGCPYFKDKSKIIELPCKVGDVIYHFKDTYHEKGTWENGERTGTVIAETLKEAKEKIKRIDDEYSSIEHVEFIELMKAEVGKI